MLLPTTINETKVTVIFLPLGLLVTLIAGAEPGKRLRYAGLTLIALMSSMGISCTASNSRMRAMFLARVWLVSNP